VTRRYLLSLVAVVAATATAFVLTPDEQARPITQAIERQPMAQPGDAAYTDATTPEPVAAVIPRTAEAAFPPETQGAEPFRIKEPAEPRRSHDIGDPIPVEETGPATRPNLVQIGELMDADAPVPESSYAAEPAPIQIGRTLDVNEPDVWYLPRTSTEVIEIGTQLDTDSPWPNQTQEREPVDIGPPIETEGFGTVL
jgi:hypothetical protein